MFYQHYQFGEKTSLHCMGWEVRAVKSHLPMSWLGHVFTQTGPSVLTNQHWDKQVHTTVWCLIHSSASIYHVYRNRYKISKNPQPCMLTFIQLCICFCYLPCRWHFYKTSLLKPLKKHNKTSVKSNIFVLTVQSYVHRPSSKPHWAQWDLLPDECV